MRPLAAVLLALALVALAAPALAAPFAAPAAPAGPVAPGALVVTALPELPAGSYEFELFLLPEGGVPIRVSAELPAGTREVRWRMPAVAARRARLVLRAGSEDAERESAPSAAFVLAQLPEGELSRLRRGQSEAGARVQSSAGAAASGIAEAPGAPSLSAATTPDSDADPAPAPLAAPGESVTGFGSARTVRARPAPAHEPRSNTPARTPLRN